MTKRIDNVTEKAAIAKEQWANIGPAASLIALNLHITRSELALRTGVKRPTLITWLDGTTPVPGWYVGVLAETLGVPVEVLFLRQGDVLRWAAELLESTKIGSRYSALTAQKELISHAA